MRPGRVLPWLIVFGAALPALVYLVDPPGRDQGVFAYIGWRWLAGDMPYLRAGLEHKGPLPFLAYAISFVPFGPSMLAARLFGWLALLVAGWGVLALARSLAPGDSSARTSAGTVAGALYVSVTGLGGLSTWWSGAQAETFMEPLIVWAAVRWVTSPGKRASSAFLSGALLGLASLGKPTVLLLIPVFLWGVGLRTAIPFLAAFLAPWGAALLAFAAGGAGGAFLDSVIAANRDYGRQGLALVPLMARHFFSTHGAFVDLRFLVPAAAGAVALFRRGLSPGSRFLLAWAAAAYVEVLAQGRLFGYHFYPIAAPVSALAGIGFVTSAAWARRQGRHGAARSAVAVATILIGASGVAGFDWGDWSTRWARATGRISETVFLSAVAGSGAAREDVDPAETLRAARWAARHLKPEETLLVWGFEPAVNFLSRRRSPTRFIYDYFLTSNAVSPGRKARYWQLFWKDVTETPPDWIAVVHNDRNPLERDDSATQLAREPRLREWLETHYEPDTQVGDFEFFRRRE